MTRERTDTDDGTTSRIEGGLLFGVGLVFFAYSIAHWFDVLTYRPPAVDFVVALGLLVWSVSLMRRSERVSVDQPTEKRDV